MLSGQHSTVYDTLCYLNMVGMSLADTTCKVETAMLSGHHSTVSDTLCYLNLVGMSLSGDTLWRHKTNTEYRKPYCVARQTCLWTG